MGELLAAVARHTTLLAAWQDVHDSANADGDPGSEILAFQRDVLPNLQTLSDELRTGQWEPDRVHQITIPKLDGTSRTLHIGSVADRIVERATLTVLDPIIDPLLQPNSFAYRKGLGVRPAIEALITTRDEGRHHVARCDIEDCFDRIPRWPVLTLLRSRIPDVEFCHLVQLLVFRKPTGPRPPQEGRGLHQGSALSPLLCNLYLDQFDRRMAARGWQVIRYADDMAVPVGSQPEGEAALAAAAEELAALDLELNTAKTLVVSFDAGVPFLGHTVTGRTRSPAERYEHPIEATVFVTTQDALVRTRGDRLHIEHGEEKLLGVGLDRVRQVVCVGRVGVTSHFLQAASKHDIDVVWLHANGAFVSRLHHTYGADVALRREQFRFADRPSDTLHLARDLVRGKINNMRALIRRAANRGGQGLDPVVARLEDSVLGLHDMNTLEQIRGTEGRASRDYFAGLATILGEPWTFTARQRRPPPDPVNAMLSFGYTLLANEAIAALEIAGLDPYVGALHAERRGRPSLALDLMEEYRPLVVDAAIVRMTTTGQITPTDFVTDEAAGSCRLTDEARRRFLAGYERRMLTLFRHINSQRTVSYRVSLTLQARILAKVFIGAEPSYTSVSWR